jgi:hypothetical protein
MIVKSKYKRIICVLKKYFLVPFLLLSFVPNAQAFQCSADMDGYAVLNEHVDSADFVFTGLLYEIVPRQETVVHDFGDMPAGVFQGVPREIFEEPSETVFENSIYKFTILKIHKNFGDPFERGKKVSISGLTPQYGGEMDLEKNRAYTITVRKQESEQDADFVNTAHLCARDLVILFAHEKYEDFSVVDIAED